MPLAIGLIKGYMNIRPGLNIGCDRCFFVTFNKKIIKEIKNLTIENHDRFKTEL